MKTKKMAIGGTSSVPLQQRLTTGQGPMQAPPQMPAQPAPNTGFTNANANAAFNRPGGMPGQGTPQGKPFQRPGPQQLATTGTPPTMPAQAPTGQTGGLSSAGVLGDPALAQQFANQQAAAMSPTNMKRGGKVKEKAYAKGGSVSSGSSASKRADGCAQRGKTRGKMV